MLKDIQKTYHDCLVSHGQKKTITNKLSHFNGTLKSVHVFLRNMLPVAMIDS